MRVGDPVSSMSAAMWSALLRDLRNTAHKDTIEVIQFPQTWASTALGFGGAGGASMTTADTTVVFNGREACVYFDGRFAYHVDRIGSDFMGDVCSHCMKSVSNHERYFEG